MPLMVNLSQLEGCLYVALAFQTYLLFFWGLIPLGLTCNCLSADILGAFKTCAIPCSSHLPD